MSHYTTQIFLFKGTDDAIENVRKVVNSFMERNPYDEVWIHYHPAVVDGYSAVECSGRNTTFGNVYDAICNCDLSELHYVDYIEGAPFGNSDLGKFLIVRDSDRDMPPSIVSCADNEETLIDRFMLYLEDKPEMRELVDNINGYGDIFELMEAINDITDYSPCYRYLECEPAGVCDFEDVDFFP